MAGPAHSIMRLKVFITLPQYQEPRRLPFLTAFFAAFFARSFLFDFGHGRGAGFAIFLAAISSPNCMDKVSMPTAHVSSFAEARSRDLANPNHPFRPFCQVAGC